MALIIIAIISLIFWLVEISLYVYHLRQIRNLKDTAKELEVAYKEYKRVIEALPEGITKRLIDALKRQ